MKKKLLTVIIVSFISGIGINCSSALSANEEKDLIIGHSWDMYSGVDVDNSGLTIHPIGRVVIDYDDNFMSHPQINLAGPHLEAVSNFSILTTLDISEFPAKNAAFYLYGKMPEIFDESVPQGTTFKFEIKDGKITVSVWDGKVSTPQKKSLGSGFSGKVDVEVRVLDANFLVFVNGKQAGDMKNPGVFAGGRLYFGHEAELGGGFKVSKLKVKALIDGKVKIADTQAFKSISVSKDSLRALASKLKKPFAMGTAVASIPLMTNDKYREVLAQEYSMLTPENDMKPQFIHPQPDIYVFNEADLIVRFASVNKMKVHAHCLIWHEATAPWMKQKRSAEAQRKIMADHITAVAGHFASKNYPYKGVVTEWDVVNEPIDDEEEPALRKTFWSEAYNGETYIDEAFKLARAADPKSLLFLNEYDIEYPGKKFELLYSLLERLLKRGVPIDGIGFQTHQYGDSTWAKPEEEAVNMKRVIDLGKKYNRKLYVRIAEIDVDSEDLSKQCYEYSSKLKMAMNIENFTAFTSWGFTDLYGSMSDTEVYPAVPWIALPFDASINPKKIVSDMKDVLKNQK